MSRFQMRTDLALETREKFQEDNVEIKGVIINENYIEKSEIQITEVIIETENASKAMGKPKGTYITLEAPNMMEPDEGYHREISDELAVQIQKLLNNQGKERSVLVVGLGNRQVTPDALGPYVVDNLLITRHVVKEYGKYALGKEEINTISSIVPGVMAQTGMEPVEVIHGIIKETSPDVIIVIDALAARNTRRLNRTIQITDAGINPGSGVGNHRTGINQESVGIPVIAIGIPTVVDAATIVQDTMKNLVDALEEIQGGEKLGKAYDSFNEFEKYQLIQEVISPHLNGMFVTPKDIDETIKRLSYTISEGLNIALQAS